ncbi:hypothetical protein DL95DRAFT_458284 [Leptodontidium sp. 2 PMI_412]|nr:hypothetical protein DL95DRAFT_458284 [Leptodontidium sp. 2 PMI_412]
MKEATQLLQIKLKQIRDRYGKQFDGKPLSTQERQEISLFLSAAPDLLVPDSEGYSSLGEINHWTRQGIFPDDLLDEAIACCNKGQGLAEYDPSNEFAQAIERASESLEDLETLLNDSKEVALLNYIHPRGHRLEGSTLFTNAILRCTNRHRENSDSEEHRHRDQINIIRLLLSHGANPNIPLVIIDDGRPALHFSVFGSDTELTKVLINDGKANPTMRGCIYRVTPLHYVVMSYMSLNVQELRDIAKFLLEQPGVTPYAPPGPGPRTLGRNAYEDAKSKVSTKDEKLIQLFETYASPREKGMLPGEKSHKNGQDTHTALQRSNGLEDNDYQSKTNEARLFSDYTEPPPPDGLELDKALLEIAIEESLQSLHPRF